MESLIKKYYNIPQVDKSILENVFKKHNKSIFYDKILLISFLIILLVILTTFLVSYLEISYVMIINSFFSIWVFISLIIDFSSRFVLYIKDLELIMLIIIILFSIIYFWRFSKQQVVF